MIYNYATLQQAVAGYLNRSDLQPDTDGIDRIQEFIQLGEEKLRSDIDWYTGTATLAYAAGDTTKTTLATVREIIAARRSTDDLPMIPLTENEFWQKRTIMGGTTPQGTPLFYLVRREPSLGNATLNAPLTADFDLAQQGLEVLLHPIPDSAMNFNFQFKGWPDALRVTASNTLLTRYPSIYLFASLIASAPFLQHDERLAMWEDQYDKAVKRARIDDERARFSGQPTRPKLPVSY